MFKHNSPIRTEVEWHFVRFGLLVTGKGEREFIPSFFQWLEATGLCHFEVIRKIEQRNPIQSPKRNIKMLGSGKTIPDRDAEEIGVPTRTYLNKYKHACVILIDDLEQDRLSIKLDVFHRYRTALDTMLPSEMKSRSAVHFFVNMLEAYYFADTNAVNTVFKLEPPITDYVGDVEQIPHPKGTLKSLLKTQYSISFDEVEDGKEIVSRLDLFHILSNPRYCRSLRVLILWCIEKLRDHPGFVHVELAQQLDNIQGDLFDPTDSQLELQ